jgi:hypothetical protein
VFEDAIQTFEKLVYVKSLDQALEIQSEYARKAYDRWMAEASKFSEMYADMARGAHKPVEQAVERKVANGHKLDCEPLPCTGIVALA